MAQVTAKPVKGQKFQLVADTGKHKIVSDQPLAAGGADGGPGPKDLVAAGLAACTIQTLLLVAPNKKWDIQDMTVTVTITYPNGAKGDPLFDELIELQGNLTAAELDAIKRTAEKCPVYKLLFGTKSVTSRVVKK